MSGSSKKFGKPAALCASLIVHVVMLGVFAAIEFSKPTSSATAASVSQAQISKVIQTPSIVAVPKIKPASMGGYSIESIKEIDIETGELSAEEAVVSANVESMVLTSSVLPSVGGIERDKVEFFGTSTRNRKMVFVVDVSGSMLGFLGQVKEQLKESISLLAADNYFYIIFFGNDGITELGNGKLIRASGNAKKKAYSFIDSVKAGGKTNALDAVERAMRIKDSSHKAAEQIFFLTDGFDMEGEYREQFFVHLKNLRKTLAPNTRFNTIGFWMEDEDRQLLARMASETGGSFTYVE